MKFEKGGIVVLKSKLYTFITINDGNLEAPNGEYIKHMCPLCIHNMNGSNYEWLDINKEMFYNEVCEPLEYHVQLFKDALAKQNKYYCEQTKTIKEMNKEFTKKDLKSGMWIECRNGNRYLLIHAKGELCGYRDTGTNHIYHYRNDLTYKESKWDIVKVWHYDNPMNTNEVDFGSEYLIWQRNDKKTK